MWAMSAFSAKWFSGKTCWIWNHISRPSLCQQIPSYQQFSSGYFQKWVWFTAFWVLVQYTFHADPVVVLSLLHDLKNIFFDWARSFILHPFYSQLRWSFSAFLKLELPLKLEIKVPISTESALTANGLISLSSHWIENLLEGIVFSWFSWKHHTGLWGLNKARKDRNW